MTSKVASSSCKRPGLVNPGRLTALPLALPLPALPLGGSDSLRRSSLICAQAAKILANLLVAGGTVLFRAATQAYRQAIISERSTDCKLSAEPAAALLLPPPMHADAVHLQMRRLCVVGAWTALKRS